MTDSAVLHAEEQGSLEGVIKGEVLRMYQEVAEHPEGEFHFYHGRQAAELFGYERDWLDRAPPGAVASFAGVGNPHLRSRLQPGETVLDLGSGDRKSTRLNSSHVRISYAVFCLKKKKSGHRICSGLFHS